LFITNGARVVSGNSYLGGPSGGYRNQVIVADPGSIWSTLTNLTFGYTGGNQLTVSNGGTIQVPTLTLDGAPPPGPINTNKIEVNGGSVIVTNALAGGTFLIGSGALSLDSGLIRADTFGLVGGFSAVVATFNFNSGTLQTRTTYWDSPPPIIVSPLVIGNGNGQAIFELLTPSSGSHRFGNGLIISSNATLKGAGTISGDVAISAGGTLSPGSSIGQIVLNGNLVLNDGSTNLMELNADTGTCDSLVGMTKLTYGGTLVLTNLAGTLVNGSAFHLFSASNYAGAFGAIAPPSPDPGLKWNTNELSIDGVLRVLALQTPPPTIASVQISGASIQIHASGGIPYDHCYLLTATNIASAAAWQYCATNTFDSLGNALFSPSISPQESVRFFRLQIE
jgi:T5SS/PEP-CTERM-associated repeat protein